MTNYNRLEELKKELEKWEDKQWMNRMVDHWTTENFNIDEECWERILELQEEIQEIEKGE